MAQVTYTIVLSTDGKHTVSATTDDPVAARGALEWAKKAYEEIIAEYGSPNQETDQDSDKSPAIEAFEEPPICPIHQAPMIKQKGKFGAFWSCHQRYPDGSWCTYRPNGK